MGCLECSRSTLVFVACSILLSTHLNQENLIFDIISYFWLYSHYFALTTNEVFLVLLITALSKTAFTHSLAPPTPGPSG